MLGGGRPLKVRSVDTQCARVPLGVDLGSLGQVPCIEDALVRVTSPDGPAGLGYALTLRQGEASTILGRV